MKPAFSNQSVQGYGLPLMQVHMGMEQIQQQRGDADSAQSMLLHMPQQLDAVTELSYVRQRSRASLYRQK